MGGDAATEGIPVDGRNTLVRDLDLPPGYYAERSESETYLMDPEGRRVMRLPRFALSEERNAEEWRELCRALLIRLSQQTAEYERLRSRAARIEERAEAAEAERDQANAIAEDLYSFFRKRVREVVDQRKDGGDEQRAEHMTRLNDSQDGSDRGGGM